jgi:hypothetical protein
MIQIEIAGIVLIREISNTRVTTYTTKIFNSFLLSVYRCIIIIKSNGNNTENLKSFGMHGIDVKSMTVLSDRSE